MLNAAISMPVKMNVFVSLYFWPTSELMTLRAAEMPSTPGPVRGNLMSSGAGSSQSLSPRAAKQSHSLSSTWQGHLSQNGHWLTGWRTPPPAPRSPPCTNTREAGFVRKAQGLRTEDRRTMLNMKTFFVQKLSFQYERPLWEWKAPIATFTAVLS